MKKLAYIAIGTMIGFMPFGAYAAYTWATFHYDTIGAINGTGTVTRFADRDNPNVICYVITQSGMSAAAPAISCVDLTQAPKTYQ